MRPGLAGLVDIARSSGGQMTYPGGKGQAGVYQAIICQFPPHRVYIEAFLGGGAIMRAKRPALVNIGLDSDPGVIAAAGEWCRHDLRLVCDDALAFLRTYPFVGDELVYIDPPYLMETRSSHRAIYMHEFASREQHIALLERATSLPAMVAISGYWSSLYATMLGPEGTPWRTIQFQAVKRSGEVATEWLWMNYPTPIALHDYRYLGRNFRERERIKRKIGRWEHRLARMPALEKQAMLAALARLDDAMPRGHPSIASQGDVDETAPDPIARNGDTPDGGIARNGEAVEASDLVASSGVASGDDGRDR